MYYIPVSHVLSISLSLSLSTSLTLIHANIYITRSSFRRKSGFGDAAFIQNFQFERNEYIQEYQFTFHILSSI